MGNSRVLYFVSRLAGRTGAWCGLNPLESAITAVQASLRALHNTIIHSNVPARQVPYLIRFISALQLLQRD